MRLIACLLCLLSSAPAAEILNQFRPSPRQSVHGTVSQVEFSTPLVELEPGALAHHLPQAMRDLQFEEPVWIIGYHTEILDAQGKAPRDNYLCHTFLSDQRVAQHEENELSGIYSDAFTPEINLPEGFGIPMPPGERFHWMPMFNNRGVEPVRVAMKMTITLIRSKDLKQPLQPLYASLRSVETPHLFFVEPGQDRREVTFQLPFNGKIHFLGTHIHPYGVSIELYNVTRREQVWKGVRSGGPYGPMGVFSSVEGSPIRSGDVYRITAVYDNPTRSRIDAMAGLFMLYSRQ